MYCPNCKIEIDGKFCFECGTRLIEKPSAGFNLNLGDANAISGGVNLQDSHDVHNIDNSINTTVNNTVNNITNVAGDITETELLQERINQFSEQVNIFLSDNELQHEELDILEELRIELGLDEATAKRLIENAREQVSASAQQTSLKGPAATIMKIINNYFKENDIENIKLQIPKLAAFARQINVDEVQYKYYVALAALDPEKLIALCEQDTLTDNYWRTYWSYIAYYKVGEMETAVNALIDLRRFKKYPEDNISLLQVAGMLNTFGEDEVRSILDTVKDSYSKELRLFARAIRMKLDSETDEGIGAYKKETVFYLENILKIESPEERAEREAIEKAEAEAKAKAEAEAKAKAEAIARKQILYTIHIKSVSDLLAAMMLARVVLGWSSSVSREKFTKFPVEAFVTDDKEKAREIYQKLEIDCMEIDVTVANGLGEPVEDGVGLEEIINNKLYPVCLNDKYGYVNIRGNVVISLQYDKAYRFSEGLAVVEKYGVKGYIDNKGKEVIPCMYEYAASFSEGLASVRRSGIYCFINKKGKEVITTRYCRVGSFHDGLAMVLNDDGDDILGGYINKKGREVIPCVHRGVSGFREGLAQVDNGFIDKKGCLVIDCGGDSPYSFSDGMAIVSKRRYYCYIDRNGKEVIPCIYYAAYRFSEGLAKVMNGDEEWGYIDKLGRLKIPCMYEYASKFSEGMAAVKKDGKYGYIDKSGNEVIPFVYDGFKYFIDGLAYVKKGDKWGYIDKTGREVTGFLYQNIEEDWTLDNDVLFN